MQRWAGWVAAAIVIVLIIYFARDIGSAIMWIIGLLGHLLWWIWIVFATAVDWLWKLFAAGLAVSMGVLTIIAELVIVGAAMLLGLAMLMALALLFAKIVGEHFKEVAIQMRDMRNEFRGEFSRGGMYAAFMALVATLCALIAYVGTEDFLEHVSTVRVLAISCIGLVAAKLFLFFPARLPKISGIALMLTILIGSGTFIFLRYGLAHDPWNNLLQILRKPENALKLLLVVLIALTSMLTLCFPFTIAEWRQLLAVSRPQLPDTGPQGLGHARPDPVPVLPAPGVLIESG